MENILEVPAKTFIGEFKAVFNNEQRAMSPNWLIYTVFYGMFLGLMVALIMGFLLDERNGYVVGYAAVIGFTTFLIKSFWTWSYRNKIIEDMNCAKVLKSTSGIGYIMENQIIIRSMAGQLKFIYFDKLPNIQKKAGHLYDYYVFNEVKDLDKRDLSIFIAIDDID